MISNRIASLPLKLFSIDATTTTTTTTQTMRIVTQTEPSLPFFGDTFFSLLLVVGNFAALFDANGSTSSECFKKCKQWVFR